LLKPGAGFGTFFSPKRLELSAFHESSLTAAAIRKAKGRVYYL
jgi:hypothetical protein